MIKAKTMMTENVMGKTIEEIEKMGPEAITDIIGPAAPSISTHRWCPTPGATGRSPCRGRRGRRAC